MQTLLTEQLETLRPILMRFALLQLRDDSLAADVVQHALIAVLEKPQDFTGQSSLRAYVIGVMKHEMVDALRKRQRTVAPQSRSEDDEAVIEQLFDADGHLRDRPRHWGRQEATLEQQDFFRVLETCLQKLPDDTARLFMMREWLGLDAAEICCELQISPDDARAGLYRARLQLRECLDLHWFGEQARQKGK